MSIISPTTIPAPCASAPATGGPIAESGLFALFANDGNNVGGASKTQSEPALSDFMMSLLAAIQAQAMPANSSVPPTVGSGAFAQASEGTTGSLFGGSGVAGSQLPLFQSPLAASTGLGVADPSVARIPFPAMAGVTLTGGNSNPQMLPHAPSVVGGGTPSVQGFPTGGPNAATVTPSVSGSKESFAANDPAHAGILTNSGVQAGIGSPPASTPTKSADFAVSNERGAGSLQGSAAPLAQATTDSHARATSSIPSQNASAPDVPYASGNDPFQPNSPSIGDPGAMHAHSDSKEKASITTPLELRRSAPTSDLALGTPPIPTVATQDVRTGASLHATSNANAAPSAAHQLATEIINRGDVLQRDGRMEVRLRLEPPDLGSVRVHLTMTDQTVDARLVVHHAATQQLIESQLHSLRITLANAGLTLGQCNVSQEGAGSQPGTGNPAAFRSALGVNQDASSPPTVVSALSNSLSLNSGKIDVIV